MMKQSIIISFLGKTQDRFSDYQTPTNTRERLELATKIKGVTGVEMVYPYETGDPTETLGWMKEFGLEFAAINANIKKDPDLVPGSLSRPDAKARKKAIEIIKGAKDYAKAVGAPLVTCCPLADGFDNLFQVDYSTSWNFLVEGVREAAEYLPEIPLFIEYKLNETRVQCHLDNVSKVLLLLKLVNVHQTGVTIDFGHAIIAQENPAQSIAICAESGVDFYLHTNDNDWRFDWDLIGGSRNFLHYVEFLFYAREYGYDKFFTTDASPRIFNMFDFFNRHSTITASIWKLVEKLDRKKIRELMAEEKAMELMEIVEKEIYRLN
jgi:xylose isomerase